MVKHSQAQNREEGEGAEIGCGCEKQLKVDKQDDGLQ